MAQITKEISVDVVRPNSVEMLVAKQGDCNSRYLKVTIMNDGNKYIVKDTSTVTINAERTDGESGGEKGEVNEDGTVTVPITQWMLEKPGLLNCDVSIVSEDGRRLTSTKFYVNVEEAAYLGSVPSDSPDYITLEELILEVKELQENGGAGGVSPTVSVSEIEGGHSVSITDVNGTSTFDVMDGEKGDPGEQGEQGADGKDALIVVTDANADELTDAGIYLCGATHTNFPAEIGNGDGGNDVVMLVFNSKTGGLADVTSQVVVGYGHIEEGVGEPLQSSVFSRYLDNDMGAWSEWAEGVTIPDGSITADKIADGIPLSKFTNDVGYTSNGSSDVLELLVSKTFDADQTGWTISEDDNGNPLNLKGVALKLTYPAIATTVLYAKAMCGSVMVGQCIADAFTKENEHYEVMKIMQEHGRWVPRWSPWNTNSTVVSTTYANEWDSLRIAGANASVYRFIDSISILEKYTIPAGATIELWGIRATETEVAVAAIDEEIS